MMCAKCRLIATGATDAPLHSDLVHKEARYFPPKNLRLAPLRQARVDEYECVTCKTRWSNEFDPSAVPQNSGLRQIA